MIEAGLVDLQQVFLPYAQDAKGRTFYELMRERKFQPLSVPFRSRVGDAERNGSFDWLALKTARPL
jgi:hypothetical protein